MHRNERARTVSIAGIVYRIEQWAIVGEGRRIIAAWTIRPTIARRIAVVGELVRPVIARTVRSIGMAAGSRAARAKAERVDTAAITAITAITAVTAASTTTAKAAADEASAITTVTAVPSASAIVVVMVFGVLFAGARCASARANILLRHIVARPRMSQARMRLKLKCEARRQNTNAEIPKPHDENVPMNADAKLRAPSPASEWFRKC